MMEETNRFVFPKCEDLGVKPSIPAAFYSGRSCFIFYWRYKKYVDCLGSAFIIYIFLGKFDGHLVLFHLLLLELIPE